MPIDSVTLSDRRGSGERTLTPIWPATWSPAQSPGTRPNGHSVAPAIRHVPGRCCAAAASGSADHVTCARSGLLGGTGLGGAWEGGVRGVSLAFSLGSQRHHAIRRPARRYLLAGFAVGSSAPAVEP